MFLATMKDPPGFSKFAVTNTEVIDGDPLLPRPFPTHPSMDRSGANPVTARRLLFEIWMFSRFEDWATPFRPVRLVRLGLATMLSTLGGDRSPAKDFRSTNNVALIEKVPEICESEARPGRAVIGTGADWLAAAIFSFPTDRKSDRNVGANCALIS